MMNAPPVVGCEGKKLKRVPMVLQILGVRRIQNPQCVETISYNMGLLFRYYHEGLKFKRFGGSL